MGAEKPVGFATVTRLQRRQNGLVLCYYLAGLLVERLQANQAQPRLGDQCPEHPVEASASGPLDERLVKCQVVADDLGPAGSHSCGQFPDDGLQLQ